jgi:bacillithiol biosynthesis cysteine-adding enzyme BshC
MSRLFASRGLVFIDAADPRLKRLGGDVFGREIAAGSAATPPALAASRKLEAAGYDSQVVLREGILQLFYAERQRRSIKWDGRAFEIQEPPEAISKDELLALAREKPFRFSPGVLLRPIYQDALLPTVAYVGGPAEIAYFAQMKGVYERFGLPMPVVYPRMTLTVVEKNVGRILEKFGLAVADLRNGAEGIIRQIGESGIPESLAGALRLASADVERDFEALAREVAAFDPTLTESARLARGRTARQIRFLEEKVLRSAKKRDGIAVAQIRKAADHLYPCGRPQERIFNVVPLLLKYGPSLIDWLDEEADLDAHDHQILRRRS